MLACGERGNASEKLDLNILKIKSSHLKNNKQFFSFQIETRVNLSFGKFTKMDI